MTITADDLVRREVHYCVSALVSTLAQGYGAHDSSAAGTDLAALAEQAFELACPIDDWEEAALQAGAKLDHSRDGKWIVLDAPRESDMWLTRYDDARHASIAYCDHNGVEPYQREVYEHWIVSEWLADKLAEKGEKVDKDFAGMAVWARTTTGQGIASDSVIEAIVADLNAA